MNLHKNCQICLAKHIDFIKIINLFSKTYDFIKMINLLSKTHDLTKKIINSLMKNGKV